MSSSRSRPATVPPRGCWRVVTISMPLRLCDPSLDGEADLVQAIATGAFQAVNGTGDLKQFPASGTIEADYLGNVTFSGVDIGLG
jgi:hypothetical protein